MKQIKTYFRRSQMSHCSHSCWPDGLTLPKHTYKTVFISKKDFLPCIYRVEKWTWNHLTPVTPAVVPLALSVSLSHARAHTHTHTHPHTHTHTHTPTIVFLSLWELAPNHRNLVFGRSSVRSAIQDIWAFFGITALPSERFLFDQLYTTVFYVQTVFDVLS